MKKLNAFTLVAILTVSLTVSVAVLLASLIATSPVAGGDSAGRAQRASLTVPF